MADPITALGDTPVPHPHGAQPTPRVSTPPSGPVAWTVTLRADPCISATVTARTAWDAHLIARLGAFSEVECTQVTP